MRSAGLCLAAILAAQSARAEPAPTCDEFDCRQARIGQMRRTGALLAAIGPGFVIRGTGAYLVGEKQTSKRLLQVGAIGLGAMMAGGLPVGVSGGSPYTMPLMPVLLLGGGMFFTSWWADIATAAGVSSPGRMPGDPPWQLELASLWLHDPYRDAGLFRLAGRIELGRTSLGGEGMIDAENEIRDGAGELRYRIKGAPANGWNHGDGSRLYTRTGLRVHRDDGDRLTHTTGEVEVVGRLDLWHVDDSLRGTFAELSTGAAVERVKFATGDSEFHSLLLGTFAWGVYLAGHGELKFFYNHRRDGIVGGIAAWRAAGFVGSLGGAVDVVLDPRWAVHLELDIGNAWLTTVGIRLRGGKR